MTDSEKTWGGKRQGSGRKVGSIKDPALKKDQRIIVMCTKSQHEQLSKMATDEGLTISALLLKRVLG